MKDTTIYLKISQNVLVKERRVTLGDIVSITCADRTIENQLKTKQVYVFDADKKVQKEIFSVLKKQKCKNHPNFESDYLTFNIV